MGTSGEKTLNNFDADRAFADTREEGVLDLEGSAQGGDFLECRGSFIYKSGIWSEEIEVTGVTPATCGRRKEDGEQRLCVQVGGIRRSYEESKRQRS